MPQCFTLDCVKSLSLILELPKKANASASDVGGVHLYWPIDID